MFIGYINGFSAFLINVLFGVSPSNRTYTKMDTTQMVLVILAWLATLAIWFFIWRGQRASYMFIFAIIVTGIAIMLTLAGTGVIELPFWEWANKAPETPAV